MEKVFGFLVALIGTWTEPNSTTDFDVQNNVEMEADVEVEAERTFISKWTTTNTCDPGKHDSEITLLADAAFEYDYDIDWGDGTPIQEHIRHLGNTSI